MMLSLLAVPACDIAETVVPVGESILVVHAVMRPDRVGSQFVVVEMSFSGTVAPTIDPVTGDTVFRNRQDATIPFGGEPPLPVNNAVVQIANLSLPSDPCGDTVVFLRHPIYEGVYETRGTCPTMRPGDRLALRVTTPDGFEVLGETTIPGLDSVIYQSRASAGRFSPTQQLVFDRDRDTLRFRAFGAPARLLQFEVRRDGDLTDFGTKILSDTTTLTVPGNLINTFVLGDEDDVFRPGRDYIVTVALTDTNYYDFARSQNNEFTGRGFINRLKGGIGVFGSLAAVSTRLRALGTQDDPREGRYRLHGTIADSFDVDVMLDLYNARDAERTDHSAFATGTWLYGGVNGTADGFFNRDLFQAVIVDTSGFIRADTIRGTWSENAPWSVSVFVACNKRDDKSGAGPGNAYPCGQRLGILLMEKTN